LFLVLKSNRRFSNVPRAILHAFLILKAKKSGSFLGDTWAHLSRGPLSLILLVELPGTHDETHPHQDFKAYFIAKKTKQPPLALGKQ